MSNSNRSFDGKKLKYLRLAKTFVLIAAVLFVIFRFVIGLSVVSGDSMLDTLHGGQIVFYTRLNGSPKYGDIVSVQIPDGDYYIKRVLALGGDTVDLRDGALYINGIREEGDYIRGVTEPEDASFTYPYDVPEGEVFVVGDNRDVSVDSRYFGSLRLNKVRGIIKFAIG